MHVREELEGLPLRARHIEHAGRELAPGELGSGGTDEPPSEPSLVRLVSARAFAHSKLAGWVQWVRKNPDLRVEVEGSGARLAEGLDQLRTHPPDSLRVSLPSMDAEVAAAIDGDAPPPRKTLDAIGSAVAAGLGVTCLVPVNATTVATLEETIVAIAEALGDAVPIVLCRRPAGDDEPWTELDDLATALAALPEALPGGAALTMDPREGYAACLLPDAARRRGMFPRAAVDRPPDWYAAPDRCAKCAYRKHCVFQLRGERPPDRLAPLEQREADELWTRTTCGPSLARRQGPHWRGESVDVPDLVCFAPFTTMALTELRHSPVPCAQAWVDTTMSPEQQSAASAVPVEQILRKSRAANAAWGVPAYDAANEDWSLREMWNAPLLRHMRRQMVHGTRSDRCRSSCRVLLGVEDRGVDFITRPDDELTDDIVRNRKLLLDEIRGKQDELSAAPLEISIGVSANCNITCGFCSGPGGLYGELSDRRREQVIELLPTLMTLSVSGPGEPLMSPSFQKLLAHIADHGYPALYLSLTTNGTLLTPSWIRRHSSFPWGHLRISLNSGSAATHERMTGKKLYDRVIENIEAAAELRDRREPPFTLTLSCVISELVLGDLEGFADTVHRYKTDLKLEPMTGNDGGLSPYTSEASLGRVEQECAAVASSYEHKNPRIADAFSAMARFARARLDAGVFEELPRR